MTSPQALFIPSHSSLETQQALRVRRVLREEGGFAVILDNGIPVSSAFHSRVMEKTLVQSQSQISREFLYMTSS